MTSFFPILIQRKKSSLLKEKDMKMENGIRAKLMQLILKSKE